MKGNDVLQQNKNQSANCLAVLGTGSDVGKSIVVTALNRCLFNRGIRVVPFKAQNMSNNSGVTPDGLEMGRAQIVQAESAKLAPCVDMNPILLKPTTEVGSQVVLMGKVMNQFTAREYHEFKLQLEKTAQSALNRLRQSYEVVIIEGAGSCAEVNLMKSDIVNLRMAEYADAPVILTADIHRGGVFAQIIGTLACLNRDQRKRIAGFIINRFRGDISLFADGVKWIESRTRKPVFGVLPWFSDFQIEAEDSVVIEKPEKIPTHAIQTPAIAVIRIPHISNFTDFDPLSRIDGLHVYFLASPQNLDRFSAVILPGSKSTRWDLDWLFKTGWATQIMNYSKNGGPLLGICGGYQIMGTKVHDPDGIEGTPGISKGLNILPVETELIAPKTTTRTRFSWNGIIGTGYEIHMGKTIRKGGMSLFQVHEKNGAPVMSEDGCLSTDGNHMGTYIHGLFDNPDIMKNWLKQVKIETSCINDSHGWAARDADYEKLARHFEKHMDMDKILQLIK